MGRPTKPNPFDGISPSGLTLAANQALVDSIPYKRKGLPSPSAVEDCIRRVWFIATGHERTEEMPASAILAAEQGKAQEGIVEQVLEGMGYEIKSDQYTLNKNELDRIACVEGSTDFILGGGDDIQDDDIVADSKRMNIYRYLDLIKQGTQKAHLPYYTQLQLYMRALGMKQGMIVAMSADHSALKGWWRRVFHYDIDTLPPPIWVEVIDEDVPWQDRSIVRAIEMQRYIDEKRDPSQVPRDYNPFGSRPDWNCDYCGFKKLCKEAR